MLTARLIFSQLAIRKMRTALTVSAIGLSVSLVVAVTSGYTSLEAMAYRYLSNYLGNTDITVTPGDYHGNIDESVEKALAADPAVEKLTPRLQTEHGLLDGAGRPIAGHVADIIGVGPGDAEAAGLTLAGGQWFTQSSGDWAVIDQGVAEMARTDVGGAIFIAAVPQPLKLRVVGVVNKVRVWAQRQPVVYVPIETLQSFDHLPGKLSRISINLKPGADDAAFVARWRKALSGQSVNIRSAGDMRKDLKKKLSSLDFLSYLGSSISMVAATFIVFSALSMGVVERSRTLAMLRAVGAGRGQLARLVIGEGLILASAGIVVGVPLGWVLLKILTAWWHQFFAAGAVLSWGGVLMGAAGSMAAALAASAVPAWSATRLSPLEALGPLAAGPSARLPLRAALAGLLLVAIDPLMVRYSGLPINWKLVAHFGLGLPSQMVGFFLMAPLLVRIVERVAGGSVARLLRVEPTLLRQQLSGAPWRAAGTCAAMMVGLAILVVMQVQGRSMLDTWKLPDRFPDLMIFAPAGLDLEQQAILQGVKGIRPHELMPVAFTMAKLDVPDDLVVKNLMPERTVFFGADPDELSRMMELDFRDDSGRHPASEAEEQRLAKAAMARLKLGRHIIVTDEFRQLYGMKVGSVLRLDTPRHGPVDYTVAGIVWSPGIDVLVNMNDLGRQFDQLTGASVFGSMADAREDFGQDRVSIFFANVQKSVAKEDVLKNLTAGLNAAPATAPGGIGQWAMNGLRRALTQWGLEVHDAREIKAGIIRDFKRLIDVLSSVAVAAMVVSALGVTNTIMASIRTRRWQLGILRSIGVTRGHLLRLILAEALLLGVIGAGMGLTAGLEMSTTANAMSKFLIGYSATLEMPWSILGMGVLMVVVTSVVASLAPAIGVARTSPLTLLQGGRAAA